MQPPKLIFWDLDGTLLDSERTWSEAPIRLLQSRGLPVPAALLPQNGNWPNWRDGIRAIRQDAALWAALGMTEEACLQWGFDDMTPRYRQSLPLLPDADTLMDAVRRLPAVSVMVTATKGPDATAACQRLGIADIFPLIHSTYAQEEKKSSPALFCHLAARFGFVPSDCLLIDNAAYALRGAKEAGVCAWGVEDAAHPADSAALYAAADRCFAGCRQLTAALLALFQ